MADRGPFGPLLPFGRRGPFAAALILLTACGVAVAVIITASDPGCRADRFGPGSGDGRDPGRPLLVDGPEALAEASRCPDRHLRQVTDLPAPNPWTPLGVGAAGGAFTGSYDGDGHRITGIRIFLPGSADVGVFAVLDGGEVRDLVLEDLVVEADGPVGAIVGRATGDAVVTGVVVRTARVAGQQDVGALVGLVDPGVLVDGVFSGVVEVAGGEAADPPAIGRIRD